MARNRIPGIPQDYFLEAINEFCSPGNYDWYYIKTWGIDELGRKTSKFVKEQIHGSLQSSGYSLNQNKSGNTTSHKYKFYCSAVYHIDIGDFIFDDMRNCWLHVDEVSDDYMEWGVRGVGLTMVNISEYKDLQLAVKLLNGEEVL